MRSRTRASRPTPTTADSGDSPPFLNGLEARGEHYVVAVASDFTAALTRSGAGQPATAVLATLPRGVWQTVRWAEGARGTLRAKCVALRCWRLAGDGSPPVGWLIGQRPGRGQTGDPKYFWSNFGPQMPLGRMVEYAHRRHWIEQF